MKTTDSPLPEGAFWVSEPGYRVKFRDTSGNQYPEASAAFYQAVESLFTEVPRTYGKGQHKLRKALPSLNAARGIQASIRKGSNEHYEAMDNLYRAFQLAIERAHASGIERGKNLLMGLAQGELTVKQFNDNAVKSEQ